MVQTWTLSRSVPPLLRRPSAATSSPMHRISSSSSHLFSFMASGAARCWPSAIARRVFQHSAAHNQPVRRVSLFTHGWRNMANSSGVKRKELVKSDRSIIPSANDVLISLVTKEMIARYGDGSHAHGTEDERRASMNAVSGDKDACRTNLDSKCDTTGEIVGNTGSELSSEANATVIACFPTDYAASLYILPNSSHCDGSIYKPTNSWKRRYRIADRNETRLEAMMLSNPTNCCYDDGTCVSHRTRHMLQVFSLKLSRLHVDCRSVELYGYIAVRDNLDPLLNYIVNISRDHPIIIEQGSLLNMTGPKRGIELVDTILIEYDMKIKIGEHEKDDVQLIDGVSILDDMDTWNRRAFPYRIYGDCGAIDITAARVNDAVEATIEILISRVRSSFNMHFGCFSSGLHEEIRLFDGSIGESCTLKRSVVAVKLGAQMNLKFKVGTDSSVPAEHCCSFKSVQHGHDTGEINTDLGLILVNVVWSVIAREKKRT